MQKTRFKKTVAIIIALVMMVTASSSIFAVSAANPEELGSLAVRALFEEDGAAVEWCDDERTISIEWLESIILLHTRKPLAYVNDEAVTLQDGITLWEGRSFITIDDLMIVLDLILQGDIDADALIDIAVSFMEKFIDGDIAEAVQMMSEEFLDAVAEFDVVGTTGFAAIHLIYLLQRGSFIDWDLVSYQEIQGFMVFDFAVNHMIGSGGFRVVVSSDGEIVNFIDLSFVFEPIPVAEDAEYTAEPIVIGEGTDWALDGLLTMPNEASAENPVPAVILVHGSGPQNMDTSIFDNRPFHDIATYLSSNGIAVLRYHKRTLTHGMALMQAYGDNLTVWEETVEDALLAAEILRADPRVSSVFVAGNSLGGMLAPRIAEEGELDGAILLGASPRPLFEVSYDQNIQHFNNLLLAGEMSQEEVDEWSVIVADLLEEARNLPNLTEEEMQGMLVFGIPAIWQRSLYDSLPLPIISRNIIPTFILHGDRDFQVWTESDFNVFVEHIEDYAHVTARLYDNVNHIFMQSQTDYNDLREYMVLGNVDRQVLRDMVEWIMNNK